MSRAHQSSPVGHHNPRHQHIPLELLDRAICADRDRSNRRSAIKRLEPEHCVTKRQVCVDGTGCKNNDGMMGRSSLARARDQPLLVALKSLSWRRTLLCTFAPRGGPYGSAGKLGRWGPNSIDSVSLTPAHASLRLNLGGGPMQRLAQRNGKDTNKSSSCGSSPDLPASTATGAGRSGGLDGALIGRAVESKRPAQWHEGSWTRECWPGAMSRRERLLWR